MKTGNNVVISDLASLRGIRRQKRVQNVRPQQMDQQVKEMRPVPRCPPRISISNPSEGLQPVEFISGEQPELTMLREEGGEWADPAAEVSQENIVADEPLQPADLSKPSPAFAVKITHYSSSLDDPFEVHVRKLVDVTDIVYEPMVRLNCSDSPGIVPSHAQVQVTTVDEKTDMVQIKFCMLDIGKYLYLHVSGPESVEQLFQLGCDPVFSILDPTPDKIQLSPLFLNPAGFEFQPAKITLTSDQKVNISLQGDAEYIFEASTIEVVALNKGVLWPGELQKNLRQATRYSLEQAHTRLMNGSVWVNFSTTLFSEREGQLNARLIRAMEAVELNAQNWEDKFVALLGKKLGFVFYMKNKKERQEFILALERASGRHFGQSEESVRLALEQQTLPQQALFSLDDYKKVRFQATCAVRGKCSAGSSLQLIWEKADGVVARGEKYMLFFAVNGLLLYATRVDRDELALSGTYGGLAAVCVTEYGWTECGVVEAAVPQPLFAQVLREKTEKKGEIPVQLLQQGEWKEMEMTCKGEDAFGLGAGKQFTLFKQFAVLRSSYGNVVIGFDQQTAIIRAPGLSDEDFYLGLAQLCPHMFKL